MTPGSPITGAAVTGLTSPTFTIVADAAPAPNGKQWLVTTLGGTQTGVTAHSTASPFFLAIYKPLKLKRLGAIVPATGQAAAFPRNSFTSVFGKGMLPLAGQPIQTAIVRLSFDIPAGADLADPTSIKSLISMVAGYLWANGDGFADQMLRDLI